MTQVIEVQDRKRGGVAFSKERPLKKPAGRSQAPAALFLPLKSGLQIPVDQGLSRILLKTSPFESRRWASSTLSKGRI